MDEGLLVAQGPLQFRQDKWASQEWTRYCEWRDIFRHLLFFKIEYVYWSTVPKNNVVVIYHSKISVLKGKTKVLIAYTLRNYCLFIYMSIFYFTVDKNNIAISHTTSFFRFCVMIIFIGLCGILVGFVCLFVWLLILFHYYHKRSARLLINWNYKTSNFILVIFSKYSYTSQ